MRTGRPVSIGLLLLCAVVVLWLVARTMGGDGGATPGDGSTAGSRPSAWASAPEEQPAADAGPTGTDTRDWDDIDACRDGVLPPELDDVAEDVEAGGPFAFPGKDGSTFGNFEGFLPDESRGYYREYTVETPGLDHRGARRIVTGGGERDPEVWYFTSDHYASFCEFAP